MTCTWVQGSLGVPIARGIMEWAPLPMRKLPQQLWRSSLAPYPPTEALLEANLMTSAHFFQSHPSPFSQNLSVFGSFPCGEGQGRPEGPRRGLPARGCSRPPPLPSHRPGLFGWDTRQRNHK